MRTASALHLAVAVGLVAGLLLLAACDGTPDDPDEATTITVLVAYTSDIAAGVEEDVEENIRRGFDETNGVYANSNVAARLVPVHMVEVDYEVTDRLEALAHLLRPDDGVLDDLHALRDEHVADIVVLVSPDPGVTVNAAVMAEPSTGFLIVQYAHLGAPSYALAHEMGHLHGARHSFDEDPALEPFPYGHGFRNDSLRTVLAGGPQQTVPFFSGPGQVYEGVVLGDSTLHDAARVVRESAVYLSNFRGPQTPTPFEPPGTWPVLPDL